MNILLLSPYPPFPPHGGGTMRIFQIARGLAARHMVTCLTFAPDEHAERALVPLGEFCRVLTVRGPEQRSMPRRAWTTAASPLPDMALRNWSRAYLEALRALVKRERFDIVQAESIEMAPYLLLLKYDRQQGTSFKCVLDQFNAEYVIQKRAALTSTQSLRHGEVTPRNLAGAAYSSAQWMKLARYERRAMEAADLVLAVSEDDRQTMLGLDPRLNVGVVPNGVDSATFSRSAVMAERAGPLSFAPHAIVFSGTLDYRPNIDAVLWFAREVLPQIRERQPCARLIVVGKRPAPILQTLPPDAVTIVGEVPDARPYIAGAHVYVVPMRIGGGVRLKLLEALALEAPVVSTAMGAEGVINLHDGEQCLLADEPATFAEAVLHLIDNPALRLRLGGAGRALVRDHYDWHAIIPRMEALYQHM